MWNSFIISSRASVIFQIYLLELDNKFPNLIKCPSNELSIGAIGLPTHWKMRKWQQKFKIDCYLPRSKLLSVKFSEKCDVTVICKYAYSIFPQFSQIYASFPGRVVNPVAQEHQPDTTTRIRNPRIPNVCQGRPDLQSLKHVLQQTGGTTNNGFIERAGDAQNTAR